MARPCGSGRVYRRGGSWWVASCVDGKEIREPGGRTQRKASKRLRDRASQGDDYAPGQDRITVKGIIEDYPASPPRHPVDRQAPRARGS